MKKFKFALQPMLNVRLSVEKLQKAELAKARAHLLSNIQILEGMQRQFDDANEECQRMSRSGTDPASLAAYACYFDYLRDVIAEQREVIRKAEKVVAACQAKLIKTMQDRKALEKLRESQLEQYRQYVQTETDKEIGDLVSYRTTVSTLPAQPK